VTILDPATGFFQLSGFVAGPHSTSDMLVQHFGAALATRALGNQWVHHTLLPQELEGEQYNVLYLCDRSTLRRIQFTVWNIGSERQTLHDPWNSDKAQQERNLFDAWLYQRMGSQREFTWGSVGAIFDARSAVSFIGIVYASSSSI
jgi:hypothetical protein